MIALEEYFSAVTDGRIGACEKLKIQADRILEAYACPGEFHYDHEIATHHTDFIEKYCRIPSGNLGAPFILEPFQKAMLQTVFGFVDDNNLRQYREVLDIIARKNGKTSSLAGVAIDLLCNDGEGAPQIYTLATKLEQAKLCFEAANKMRQLSPMLTKHLKKRAADIYFPENMGYIKALSSETSTGDGLDVHGAVIDELGAIKNRDIYDLTKQGMAARRQPLLFCITTNNFVRNGIFDAQYEYAKKILQGKKVDKRFLPLIYELDSYDEWDQPDKWIKANPGLGTIRSVEFLEDEINKAKDDPSYKPTVMVKDFNLPQTSKSSWLRNEEIVNEATWDMSEFDYCVGGIDAADSIDLAAAKAVCMRPNDDKIYVLSMYWIPEEVIRQERATRRERDNAPYELWVQQGYLRTCPGNKVDKRVFLDWFVELREQGLYTMFIGYDPWHISEELLREFRAEFGKNSMIPVRQGRKTESEPLKEIRADLQAKRIVYNNNPIDKWCLRNSCVDTDINGNIQLVKNADRRNRNDGTSALMDAYVVLRNNKDKYINMNEAG